MIENVFWKNFDVIPEPDVLKPWDFKTGKFWIDRQELIEKGLLNWFTASRFLVFLNLSFTVLKRPSIIFVYVFPKYGSESNSEILKSLKLKKKLEHQKTRLDFFVLCKHTFFVNVSSKEKVCHHLMSNSIWRTIPFSWPYPAAKHATKNIRHSTFFLEFFTFDASEKFHCISEKSFV